MITTTLERIYRSCYSGRNWNDFTMNEWRVFFKTMNTDFKYTEVLPYSAIVKKVGLVNALYFCKTELRHSHYWRVFAINCANSVVDLSAHEISARKYLEVAKQFVRKEAPLRDLKQTHSAFYKTLKEDCSVRDRISALASSVVLCSLSPNHWDFMAGIANEAIEARALNIASFHKFLPDEYSKSEEFKLEYDKARGEILLSFSNNFCQLVDYPCKDPSQGLVS